MYPRRSNGVRARRGKTARRETGDVELLKVGETC